MRISSYHKMRGDRVEFVRGRVLEQRNQQWDRIYVSSLFTWELPRTVETIQFYNNSVASQEDIIVGGVGATLLPAYIRENVRCRIIEGLLDVPGQLDPLAKPVSRHPLDYTILDSIDYEYQPKDAYFCKTTIGCIRSCAFCAVPILEPTFGPGSSLTSQVKQIQNSSGDKQNLILLDNNVLGIEGLDRIFAEIRSLGFEAGSRRNNRVRTVDFNQGLDARLVNQENARLLASVNLSPLRLAYDHEGMERAYRRAIHHLVDAGHSEFTNYLLFNFADTPAGFYGRLQVNQELNRSLGIRITGFPMRFIPMDDVKRGHIGKHWRWRYLRGMQCILLATRGLVSPNPSFVARAFGSSYDEFIETLCMPDRYIIWRASYERGAAEDWRKQYRKLSESDKDDLYEELRELNLNRARRRDSIARSRFAALLEHYYPDGKTPANRPAEAELAVQGLATGYDILDPSDRERSELGAISVSGRTPDIATPVTMQGAVPLMASSGPSVEDVRSRTWQLSD